MSERPPTDDEKQTRKRKPGAGRPKKPRMINGVVLAENLYKDNFGRDGYFRYRRPDGSFFTFPCPSAQEANALAKKANADRGLFVEKRRPPPRGSWGDLAGHYIEWREKHDPELPKKLNWQHRRYMLHAFGRDFGDIPVKKLQRHHIADWWEELSHHQQNARHTELRRFFNWVMGKGYCPQLDYNPFTTSDDRPRLYLKAKEEKKRAPLNLATFWEIYKEAGDRGYFGLQNAMALSLFTTMRQGDILKLRFDQIQDDVLLRVVIGKSEAQRGAASATRLEWSINEYPLLREVVNRARETSLTHLRCPFVIHYKTARSRAYPSNRKEHPYQLLQDQLQKQFKKCRPAIENPTTFHEIRALSSVVFRRIGGDMADIQRLMAHTDEATTLGYQDRHDLPYERVGLRLSAADIEGKL
jgi:integrase